MSNKYPHMLVMRNTPSGMIWQAYEVKEDKEVDLLTKSAKGNGFCVEHQPVGYTEETWPGWRDTQEWKDYSNGVVKNQDVYDLFKTIRRDGPYWLGGYKDWLVCCYSLRNMADLDGFIPIACWSEIDGCCKQWLVCKKDGQFYVDRLFGTDRSRGYGLKPILATEQTYPPHIYDWLFKRIIPSTPI